MKTWRGGYRWHRSGGSCCGWSAAKIALLALAIVAAVLLIVLLVAARAGSMNVRL